LPAAGYFGTRKACETVHVQYSYDDGSVAVVNGSDQPKAALKVSARLYGLDAQEKASRETVLDVPPDSSTPALGLPRIEAPANVYFLRLQLHEAGGRLASDNFYWLSTRRDVLDWAQTKGTAYTPQLTYADVEGLAQLPNVAVTAAPRVERQGSVEHMQVQ